MIVTFVDKLQIDQSGKSVVLGTADVVSEPRMGETQTLVFPNMPVQNYLVVEVARRTHIGSSTPGGQLSPEMQQLPQHMQQLFLKQIAVTASQSQSPNDEIFIVLRKLDQEATRAS